jgi:aarF domain-containing kinase
MIAVLNRDEQENFIGLLAAMGKGDALEAADYVLRFSSKTRHSGENVLRFKEDMKLLFAKVCRGYGTGTDVGTVLRGLLGLLRDHKITIDANYATLVLNALCLDGLGGQILPMYNILDAAKPLLEFYRNCKRTIGLKLFHALVPLAQHLKRGGDNKFLQNLKRGVLTIEQKLSK